MNALDHPTTPGSGDAPVQAGSNEQQQQGNSVDTCTMDPCPMKAEDKNDIPEKCPKCGMTDEHS